MKKTISRIYVIFVFILLYAPIAVLIAFSFNNSRTRAKWGGFTFKWYLQMFQDAEIMLNRMKRRNRTVMLSVLNIPMLNADIVTGISLMLIFIAFGQFLTHYGYTIVFGFGTVLVGHITFNIPYTVMSILPRVSAINPSTYEAALDLGASPSQAFRKVVFPDILPGILSGFLLAFTLSLDDFVITHFVKGPGFDTLSTKIYTEVRKGIKPEMYALSTLLFLGVLLLLIVVEKGKGARNKNRKPAY